MISFIEVFRSQYLGLQDDYPTSEGQDLFSWAQPIDSNAVAQRCLNICLGLTTCGNPQRQVPNQSQYGDWNSPRGSYYDYKTYLSKKKKKKKSENFEEQDLFLIAPNMETLWGLRDGEE